MTKNVSPGREIRNTLKGKTAFVTGATGLLGGEVAKEFARRGAKVILHYHSHVRKALELELAMKMLGTEVFIVQADYSRSLDMRDLVRTVNAQVDHIDFLVHTAGICRRQSAGDPGGETERAAIDRINQIGPIEITLGLEEKHRPGDVILFVGSSGEDTRWERAGASDEAKNGLHHFAAHYADAANQRGVRCIYYLPGVVRDEERQDAFGSRKREAMLRIGQVEPLNPVQVARNIVSSMMNEPIGGVEDAFEGHMLIRRDGYRIEA
jgi:NAD(P)-dependent dehydrogenase (short-subunit alcohol dehydrogenase family)